MFWVVNDEKNIENDAFKEQEKGEWENKKKEKRGEERRGQKSQILWFWLMGIKKWGWKKY